MTAFQPGHLDICSSQMGDPEDCAVCRTKPPMHMRSRVAGSVKTLPMPPYYFQTPQHGSGSVGAKAKP